MLLSEDNKRFSTFAHLGVLMFWNRMSTWVLIGTVVEPPEIVIVFKLIEHVGAVMIEHEHGTVPAGIPKSEFNVKVIEKPLLYFESVL